MGGTGYSTGKTEFEAGADDGGHPLEPGTAIDPIASLRRVSEAMNRVLALFFPCSPVSSAILAVKETGRPTRWSQLPGPPGKKRKLVTLTVNPVPFFGWYSPGGPALSCPDEGRIPLFTNVDESVQ